MKRFGLFCLLCFLGGASVFFEGCHLLPGNCNAATCFNQFVLSFEMGGLKSGSYRLELIPAEGGCSYGYTFILKEDGASFSLFDGDFISDPGNCSNPDSEISLDYKTQPAPGRLRLRLLRFPAQRIKDLNRFQVRLFHEGNVFFDQKDVQVTPETEQPNGPTCAPTCYTVDKNFVVASQP
ncbi:MAG: hypothetical protein H6728_08300 [Myxococcales bacterium]|nr:hypothetical protein [Myxococcales bacterium]